MIILFYTFLFIFSIFVLKNDLLKNYTNIFLIFLVSILLGVKAYSVGDISIGLVVFLLFFIFNFKKERNDSFFLAIIPVLFLQDNYIVSTSLFYLASLVTLKQSDFLIVTAVVFMSWLRVVYNIDIFGPGIATTLLLLFIKEIRFKNTIAPMYLTCIALLLNLEYLASSNMIILIFIPILYGLFKRNSLEEKIFFSTLLNVQIFILNDYFYLFFLLAQAFIFCFFFLSKKSPSAYVFRGHQLDARRVRLCAIMFTGLSLVYFSQLVALYKLIVIISFTCLLLASLREELYASRSVYD